SAPPRDVWKWLSEDERYKLYSELTRGFQRTANALRQPVVRARFAKHLRGDDESFKKLLALWAESAPRPHIIDEVSARPNDGELVPALPALWRQHGGEALLLALIYHQREAAIDAYAALDEEALETETETEVPDEIVAEPTIEAPKPEVVDDAALTSLREQLASAWAEATRWRERANQLRTENEKLQLRTRNETQKVQLAAKQEERRAILAEGGLAETKKTLDRTSRRLRSVEKELEEANSDARRLKRQLRQAQQLHEELRKQLASVTQRLQAFLPQAEEAPKSTTEKPKVVAIPKTTVISTLDQQFVWKSDGRPFRVSPREVGKAIDRNDEEFVFALIQAFEALREMNVEGYKLFMSRIRELGRYYLRVLTADTTRVLIDASNVARYEKDRHGRGQLRHLITMRNELRLRDCFPILVYADASLRYNIDEPAELLAMATRGELEITPAGTEADEALAREARRSGAYVVTNDRNFHTKVSPDFEPPRITFRILDGFVAIDDF
ncbi:MAG TPA: hypothetical protein VF719_02345, partial [Abditibacteriaceae bacterium]